jgi:transposase
LIGRKNWLFAVVEASACLYGLIETAKANNLEPYKYLRYLFEKLPFASSKDDYRALLPHNLGQTDLVQENTVSGV